MLEYGWIKMHRKFLKWEWYDDINTKTVFLHLLLTVNATDERWHGIEVKRGSRIASFAKLAAETKLSVQQVRTSISKLESTGEVTRCSHSKYTVFSVKNYEKYQEVTSTATNNQQTNNKQITSNQQQSKKVKESIRKNKNITQCVCAPENCGNDTHNSSSIPTMEQVAGMAAEIGAVWDADECRRFLDYNLDRNRKSGWEQAVKLWESHRKPKSTAEMDQETVDDYLSCVNRFRKEGCKDGND